MNAAIVPEQHVLHGGLTVSTSDEQAVPEASRVPGGGERHADVGQ